MRIGYLNVFGGMFHLEPYKMTGAKLINHVAPKLAVK